MLDRSSQVVGRQGHQSIVRGRVVRNLPQIYIPAGKGRLPELYLRDASARRLISRLKWFISTCVVGAVGLCIIGIAMYASTDMENGSGMYGSISSAAINAMKPKATGNLIEEKVALTGEKTDKIQITTKGLTTKYIIHDSIVERRNSREFITVKPYLRIAATLSTVKPENSDAIPQFNPFDLYAADNKSAETKAPGLQAQAEKGAHNQFLIMRVLELAGGFLPDEDRQELADDEVERFVAEADAVYAESAAQLRPGIISDLDGAESSKTSNGATAENNSKTLKLARTTILEKMTDEDDSADDGEVQSLIVKAGDTLVGLLKTAGAEAAQAQEINDVFARAPGGFKLRAGQEVRLQLVPAASDPSLKEPIKVSVLSGVKAEATVMRSDDGDYVLTDEPVEVPMAADSDDDGSERATLYNSIYSAALAQDLDPKAITAVLRTLSYDVDYKQKVHPKDGFELFFDVKPGDEGAEKPGELLYVSMTVGGESYKYYRFRTPDGEIDFYNPKGSNSRKFLMKQPVRGGRFTSGFGPRRHPLLGITKMHTGIDWAAPTGTPIMSAGNGTIEEAGRHGANGNYVRIRHGNGYKTAYSHMSRIAPGIKKGMKIRQGDLIGYVGTTGMSTGPHLHYEVLINNRFTNPLKVHVPRSRQLNGRMFAEFRKEEQRIDELMRREPVKTRVATVSDR